MKRELDEKLFNDFPLLYDKRADVRSSCMAFGFECGDGWYQLIRELSEKLYPLVTSYQCIEGEVAPRVVQVKEKYGTLRFYMDCSTEEMDDIIHEYEDRSCEICETCGKPGELDQNTCWLSTVCEEHRSK